MWQFAEGQHVLILAASICNLDHLLYCFSLAIDLAIPDQPAERIPKLHERADSFRAATRLVLHQVLLSITLAVSFTIPPKKNVIKSTIACRVVSQQAIDLENSKTQVFEGLSLDGWQRPDVERGIVVIHCRKA
jgi:hypothetical protein